MKNTNHQEDNGLKFLVKSLFFLLVVFHFHSCIDFLFYPKDIQLLHDLVDGHQLGYKGVMKI